MKILILPLLMVLVFNSCSNTENCENKVCTAVFVSVSVKFTDSNGNALVIKDYQSKNLRTGKLLTGINTTDTIYAKGNYTVASDGNLKEIGSSDKILVSGKHPVTNVLKQAEFIIGGGGCACHVTKIAGPDEIRF